MKDDIHNSPIKVIVVGSIHSGKTTLCNQAKQFDNTGSITFVEISDPEDILNQHPDAVIQVVDCRDLDESLVITPQLIDMHQNLMLAFNHYDELKKTDHSLDFVGLSQLLGTPVVTINALSGEGVEELLARVKKSLHDTKHRSRHIHVEYGRDIEEAIVTLRRAILSTKRNESPSGKVLPGFSLRYLAIRLLENPHRAMRLLQEYPYIQDLETLANKLRKKLERDRRESVAQTIHEARHGFIHGALEKTLHHSDDHSDHSLLERIDAVLTNRWLGFPILIGVLFLVFQCTFTLGAYPQQWISNLVQMLCSWLSGTIPEGWFSSMLIDGVVQGVGAVVSFLPNIIILFFFISLMEDSGYMARAAYLMDGIMHRVGLHGRSFIPMLIGFGCNVPAIMAARSINNLKDRTLTMLMIPFMSCSARLPVYMLLVSAFFARYQALVMISIYLVGILLSILFALIMKRTRYFRKGDEDYVSELPKFRRPTLRNTGLHIWKRVEDYLKKISTVILCASIIIWALYYFPRNEKLTEPYQRQIEQLYQAEADGVNSQLNQLNQLNNSQFSILNSQFSIDSLRAEMDAVQKEHSALATIGRWMEPVMKPLGFDWKMNVCVLTGLPAKEAIVSTMGILYRPTHPDATLNETLRQNQVFTPFSAYAFMVFVLLYFPCIATVATIRREIGRGWAAFTVVHSLLLAWLMAFAIFQIGTMVM